MRGFIHALQPTGALAGWQPLGYGGFIGDFGRAQPSGQPSKLAFIAGHAAGLGRCLAAGASRSWLANGGQTALGMVGFIAGGAAQ